MSMWVSLFSFFCQGHVGKVTKKILSGKIKSEFRKLEFQMNLNSGKPLVISRQILFLVFIFRVNSYFDPKIVTNIIPTTSNFKANILLAFIFRINSHFSPKITFVSNIIPKKGKSFLKWFLLSIHLQNPST